MLTFHSYKISILNNEELYIYPINENTENSEVVATEAKGVGTELYSETFNLCIVTRFKLSD